MAVVAVAAYMLTCYEDFDSMQNFRLKVYISEFDFVC